jgi:hypothetical protein
LKDCDNGIKTEEKQLSSYLPDHGIAEVTKEKEDNSRPVSVKEISLTFFCVIFILLYASLTSTLTFCCVIFILLDN